MKKLFKNIIIAAILVMGGLYVSCTSVTDELTELSLTRCLEPLNLEHTISNGDSVIFGWDLVTGADHFALQVAIGQKDFENNLYKDLTVSADSVPYGIKLIPDTTFFFRVQAQADNGKEPSKWAEYIDTIATYAVRSNLNLQVTERTANSISLSWDQDPEVTHITYTPRDEAQTRYTLTAEDIAAGTATITGLSASTSYTVTLYFQSANRGELSLYTMPDLSNAATVSTLEDLQAAFKDGAAEVALSMDGSPYEIGQVDLVSSMNIYGMEAADGTRPVIIGEVHINTASLDHFYSEGIEWNGNESEFGFVIQLKNGGGLSDVQIGSITYKNSTITGYSKGIMYEWGQGMTMDNYILDGCTVYDIPGSGGDGFDLRQATTTLGNLTIQNSTVYNSFRSFIRLDADVQVSGAITLQNNTIMGLSTVDNSTNNRGVIGIRTTAAAGKVYVNDNIFLNMTDFSTMISASEANLAASDMSFAGNYFYNVAETFFNDKCTEASATAGGGSVLGSDPCYNSEGMIFNITNSNVLSAGAGDPRWLVEYVEPPIDNELPLIEGAKTWDLTDASVFSGEMKVTQVKDQLRFIVSEENTILLEDGLIKFTAEGVTNPAGAVTAGGLEFHVDKPGSVLIKTADYDDITGNHVVVSLNGTVKGGAATQVNYGTVQKIIVTDIAEETPIYLYASGPIAIESLAWSNDTTQVNTALPTPENVTAAPAAMVQGEATDIVITWDEVENAGSYSVSFNNGASETVDGTTYTVPASQTGFLQPGCYSVRVFANPAEGDIYNTQSSAGYVSFAVLAGGGQGGGTTVTTADELFSALSAGVGEITLEAGTYDFTSVSATGLSEDGVYTVSGDLSLTADGDVSVIGAFKFGAGAGDVILDGITFSGNNQAIGNFLEDVEGETAVQSVIVRNCEISGYGKSIIYISKDGSSISSIEFTGNHIHDMGTGQGSFDIRKGSVGSLTVQSNTINNGSRDMFRADADVTGMSSMVIANNTFANITGGNSNGFARVRAVVAGGITISNNLFLNMMSSNYPFVHSNTTSENTVNLSNNFFYNFHEEWFSDMDEATATANGGAVLTASPVADIDGGDFTLTNAVLMAKKAGDPRWNPQADMPSSSSIEVNSIDELVNAIASGATDFTLNAGTYDFRTPGASGASGFSEDGVLTASSNLSLRGNGDVTVIGGIKLGAGLSSLYLYGIHFDGASQAVGNFIEDVDGATASTAISVRNCEISGYAKSIIYVSKETSSVGDVEFAGNLIHDMGTGQGSFDIRKGAAVSLTVMNNTIYNGSRDIFRIDADVAGVSGVSISNNTFYNITGGNSNGFARIRAAVSGGITISNNIFVDMLSSNYPFVHSNTSSENIVNISNNFFYNFHEEWFSNMDEATAIANGGAVLTASPLADPANGDFTVTDATVKAAGAGDGRWL